ncbi:MAG: hypothetical protein QM486_07435 [Flavobacteriaceae bacterium]
MIVENYYSKSMPSKSDTELQEYVNQKDDFQEEAVLAAICELEKRGALSTAISTLKEALSRNLKEADEPIGNTVSKNNAIPLIYSNNFILIFGVLFSVFGAGILIAMNFMQLKKVKTARIYLFAGLGYSLFQMFVFSIFKTTSPLISVASSLLGVYMLSFYSNKEMPEDLKTAPRNIWNPIMIAILISLPLAFIVLKMSGQQ